MSDVDRLGYLHYQPQAALASETRQQTDNDTPKRAGSIADYRRQSVEQTSHSKKQSVDEATSNQQSMSDMLHVPVE